MRAASLTRLSRCFSCTAPASAATAAAFACRRARHAAVSPLFPRPRHDTTPCPGQQVDERLPRRVPCKARRGHPQPCRPSSSDGCHRRQGSVSGRRAPRGAVTAAATAGVMHLPGLRGGEALAQLGVAAHVHRRRVPGHDGLQLRQRALALQQRSHLRTRGFAWLYQLLAWVAAASLRLPGARPSRQHALRTPRTAHTAASRACAGACLSHGVCARESHNASCWGGSVRAPMA